MSRYRPRRSRQPINRETRLADELGNALERMPSFREGDQVIVMVHHNDPADVGREHHMGLGMFGYDDDAAALTDMMLNLQSVMETTGRKIQFVFPDDLRGPN